MDIIKISGKLTGQNLPQPLAPLFSSELSISWLQEIALEPVRNAATPITLTSTETNTILELEFEGGYKRWLQASELAGLLGVTPSAHGEILLTPFSFAGVSQQGQVGLVLKFLRVVNLQVTNPASTAVVEQLEAAYITQPGLYCCVDTTTFKLELLQNHAALDANQPLLLLIPDLAMTTQACFGELWESRQGYNAPVYVQRLFAPYAQQILSYDYRSLTVEPLQNALALAQQLPDNATLHIVGYGFGGLLGELLCQGGVCRQTTESKGQFVPSDTLFTPDEQHLLASNSSPTNQALLTELESVLKRKQFKIERFVRIASPMRGTLLAAESLTDLISLTSNTLLSLNSPPFKAVADYLLLVLLAAATEKRELATLPGLAGLKPTAPLVRLLNRANIRLNSDLTIIAGNVQTSAAVTPLQIWAARQFRGEEHDYQVNTASMYGGAARLKVARFYVDQRLDTNHFGYLRDAAVRERLINALQQPDNDPRLSLLETLTTPRTRSATTALRPEDKTSTVYLVPGFMGSQLQVNNRPIWLDMGALTWGDFTTLGIDASGVTANGVVPSIYQNLIEFLDQKQRVVPFAYDWRQSFQLAGQQLAQVLTEELDQAKTTNKPLRLRLLAHSSGGLVILAMLQNAPTLWQRLRDEADCRCVFLGTPLQGTYTMVQLLLGQHRLLSLLNMLDGNIEEQQQQQLVEQFTRYPGVLELLPPDFQQASKWQSLLGEDAAGWPAMALLANAQQVSQQLQAVNLDAQRCLYIYGQARLTPNGLQPRDGTWQFSAEAAGDGVTLWASLNRQLPTWFMPVEHGRMASQANYFPVLQQLLDSGITHQLDNKLPSVDSNKAEWLPSIRTELFPTEEELAAAALGYHTLLTQEEVKPLIELQVWHGDLIYTAHPIMLGHYEGDAIISAEAVMDRALNKRLSELLRLGLYPGAIGTSKVFLNLGKRPAGAIVVGLGEVGKLTAGQLNNTVVHALLDYCLEFRERLVEEALTPANDTDFTPIHIATLLIGTAGGGSISLADSITAILRAVTQTNNALDKMETGARVRVQLLEFIELYEDRAVEAARLLQEFVALPEFHADFTLKSLMQILPGNRRRVMYNDPPGWWRRIQVEASREGLKFITLTDRARAELMLQATQRKLVDQFIAKAITSSHDDPDIGKILFELLLPQELKNQTPTTDNLVLVLDEQSASYPWELLYNRLDAESQPLAVRIGILRQLQIGQYRQQVFNVNDHTALVVGDPPTDGNFVRLEAARQEALAVADVLEAGQFKVSREIGTDAASILKALHTADYRVMHLAGHGVYRYQADQNSDLLVTGMVLGNGLFLTPVEIGQMRKVPELAFVNCCHLARLDSQLLADNVDTDQPQTAALTGDRVELAASFAQSLISIGVRAVIAAGWAIDDNAAKVFARSCYQALIKGHTFGDAVLMARRETWKQYPSSNTWGAYQCYGDPDYKLVSRQPEDDDNQQTNDAWQFVAEVEVSAELQNIVNMAENAQVEDFQWLQQRLQKLHAAIPAEWVNHASILYELGNAYGKLDMFAPALAAYDAALDAPQADYPVVLLEDKVSLQTAWALAWSQGKVAAPEAHLADKPADFMQQSLRTLHLLEDLGNSLQRFEETGKFWKRQSMMADGHKRDRALQAMEAAYKKAHDFAMQRTNCIRSYPLINWLTAKVVRYLRGDIDVIDKKEVHYWLEQLQPTIEAQDRISSSFLTGITRAEYTLLVYLVSVRLTELSQLNAVFKSYAEAMERGSSPRQLRYIAEHLTFLQLMLQESQTDKPYLQPIVMALLDVSGRLGV